MSDKHKDAQGDVFLTVVYKVPCNASAAFSKQCTDSMFFSAASWSHTLDDRDAARRASQVSAAAAADSIGKDEGFLNLLDDLRGEVATGDRGTKKELIAYIDNFRASEGQAQTSAAVDDYVDCPACMGSRVRGEKRGVRCSTCSGSGTVAAQLADSTGGVKS